RDHRPDATPIVLVRDPKVLTQELLLPCDLERQRQHGGPDADRRSHCSARDSRPQEGGQKARVDWVSSNSIGARANERMVFLEGDRATPEPPEIEAGPEGKAQ